jgi:hypothetical protein
MRYIEINPVRATMVEDPAHYRWTSYRANALGQTSPLLVPHSVYLSLGATDKARQAAYRHLLRYHLDEEMVSELRLAANQNQPLGKEGLYETIERMAENYLTSLRAQIASLRIVKCRMAHERVVGSADSMQTAVKGGPLRNFKRVGLCSPAMPNESFARDAAKNAAPLN